MIPFARSTRRAALAGAAALIAAGCSSAAPAAGPSPTPAPAGPPAPVAYVPLTTGLPPIPPVQGPLAIHLVAPEAGETKPRRDSTFLYGSVGSGGAALTINGTQVPVAPNGAFLTYLPVPADGVFHLSAFRGADRADATYAYRMTTSPAAPAPQPEADTATEKGGTDTVAAARPASNAIQAFTPPRAAIVVRGSDTLATGSDAIYGRPSPTGTYRWFFPRGTRLLVAERRRGQYRVQLGASTSAYVDTLNVRLSADTTAGAPVTIGAQRSVTGGAAPEVRIAAGFAPFLVQEDSAGVHVTVYGADGGGDLRVAADDFVTSAAQDASAPGELTVSVALSRWVWGYRAYYERDGTLVVRLRRPPRIDPANPLRGIRIVVDPGHPPGGAPGPTGYQERDANLAIALRVADKLRAAGAIVTMTRTGDYVVDLAARPAMAVAQDADILLSIHNNAYGADANPYRAQGTSTYWFQPSSADLARALDREIDGVTQLPDLGAMYGNLALVRPTWFPSTLTESLFMPVPEQEAALRDPGFLNRLADAHVRGIADFLRMRAGAAESAAR